MNGASRLNFRPLARRERLELGLLALLGTEVWHWHDAVTTRILRPKPGRALMEPKHRRDLANFSSEIVCAGHDFKHASDARGFLGAVVD
jgi:hypothetical protein